MTCQTCISFKRRDRDSGECFSQSAITLHNEAPADRMDRPDDYVCDFHAPRSVYFERDLNERIIERAAIMEFDGNMLRIHAEPLAEAAQMVRAAMFQQGKARE